MTRRDFLSHLPKLPSLIMQREQAGYPEEVTFPIPELPPLEIAIQLRTLHNQMMGVYDLFKRMNARVSWLEDRVHDTGPYYPSGPRKT